MSKFKIAGYQKAFSPESTAVIARITIVASGCVTLVSDDGESHTFTDPGDETMGEIKSLVKG